MFFKTDKLDYLGSPETKLFFESFFFIGQNISSTGKWIWNLLGFSSFISILGQCVLSPFYCVVNLDIGKFGPHDVGGCECKGVSSF